MMIFKFVTVSIVAMTAEARRPHHARLDFFNQFDLTPDCKAFVVENIDSVSDCTFQLNLEIIKQVFILII